MSITDPVKEKEWDRYFVEILKVVSSKSQDRSTKFGAVITDPLHRLLSTGYNGIPRGVEYEEHYHDRPDKYMYFVHAEQNAIFNAVSVGTRLDNARIYVLEPPCAECVKAIIQSGITWIKYVYTTGTHSTDIATTDGNWRISMEAADELVRKSGITMTRARL